MESESPWAGAAHHIPPPLLLKVPGALRPWSLVYLPSQALTGWLGELRGFMAGGGCPGSVTQCAHKKINPLKLFLFTSIKEMRLTMHVWLSEESPQWIPSLHWLQLFHQPLEFQMKCCLAKLSLGLVNSLALAWEEGGERLCSPLGCFFWAQAELPLLRHSEILSLVTRETVDGQT